MRHTCRGLGALAAAAVLACSAASARAASTDSGLYRLQPDGVVIHTLRGGYVRLQAVAPNIVRVMHSPNPAFFSHTSIMADPNARHVKTNFRFNSTGIVGVFSTHDVFAGVDLATGDVTLGTHALYGTLLEEAPGGRAFTPATIPAGHGETAYNVSQKWLPQANESLYGLGQHQLGLMDIKGYSLDLWQHNGTIVVPFLTSSKGYGVLWDNNSYSRFGSPQDAAAVPADQLLDASGKPGGLSVAYYDAAFEQPTQSGQSASLDIAPPPAPTQPPGPGQPSPPPPVEAGPISGSTLPTGDAGVRWTGYVAPKQTGDYIFTGFSNGSIQLRIGGKLVMDHWRQNWLAWKDVYRIHMLAGQRYPIQLDWDKIEGADTIRLQWQLADPSRAASLWSQVGEGVDYYFVYGPKLDSVIAGYRHITGAAPLMPQWAYGFWQSRDHYKTQQESLDVVNTYRVHHIPFDNIVQDWQYWPANAWGSHQFDPARYPDPNGWIRAIHAQHAHLMISVWPKFYTGTANFDALNSRGYLYPENLKEKLRDWLGYVSTDYDAFNPSARKLYWQQIDKNLFSKGIDAWWMDASEPDMLPTPTLPGMLTHVTPTYFGPGARVMNAYPLENAKAIETGQREAAPNQRVFMLTRSGFAGMQRYSAAVWSGDTTGTWTAYRKQIAAALGISLSGYPYWTMDIGGYVPGPKYLPDNGSAPNDAQKTEWNELNVRWFQFGTFVPLLRVHGQGLLREMWQFGGFHSPAYNALLESDRLRYALMPYTYSVADEVTSRGSTFMRPLVMDFPSDSVARETGDEYLFGPSILVSPVTAYQARSRPVYLPSATGGWYDLWSGRNQPGGRTIDAPAPYDKMPLHVRAGSILPAGPQIEWVGQKPNAPITVYVYAGANGAFTLYEDDGLTYDYQHGACSRIPMAWNDATRTLTLGARSGRYNGMPSHRVFNVILVSKSHPAPFSITPQAGRTVSYSGKETIVSL